MYTFIAILALSSAVAAQTSCPGSTGCTDDTQCGAGINCILSTASNFPFGCCNVITTTVATTTTAATTTAAVVTATTRSTCVDLLNPLTGVSDCPARSNLCTNSVYLEVMRVQCPRTCGFCSNSSSNNTTGTCVDLTNPSTGTSDCPARRAYCNNAIYNALMRVQCPATCGFC